MESTYISFHSLCRLVHNQQNVYLDEKKKEAAGEELAAVRIQLLTPCQCSHFNLEF